MSNKAQRFEKPLTIKLSVSWTAIYRTLSLLLFAIEAVQEDQQKKTISEENIGISLIVESSHQEIFKALFRSALNRYERFFFTARHVKYEPIIISSMTKKEREDFRHIKPIILKQIEIEKRKSEAGEEKEEGK